MITKVDILNVIASVYYNGYNIIIISIMDSEDQYRTSVHLFKW